MFESCQVSSQGFRRRHVLLLRRNDVRRGGDPWPLQQDAPPHVLASGANGKISKLGSTSVCSFRNAMQLSRSSARWELFRPRHRHAKLLKRGYFDVVFEVVRAWCLGTVRNA